MVGHNGRDGIKNRYEDKRVTREANPVPSEKQVEVLSFIIDQVQKYGYQPSQQEIAEHFGVSKNAITQRLKDLAKRGIIAMEGNKERAVKIAHLRFKAEFVKGEPFHNEEAE